MTSCRFRFMLLVLVFILASLPSDAVTITVNATVFRIVDGDTIHVWAHLWPRQSWQGNIRLHSIDTPEPDPRSRCQAETEQTIMAKETLRSLIPREVRLNKVKPGKFGNRFVANVMDGTRDLADVLMENGVDPTSQANGNPGATNPWPASGNDTNA